MRTRVSRRSLHAFICAVVLAGVAGLYQLERAGYASRTLLDWEYRYRDSVTRTGRFNPPDEQLVFVGIDSTSVSLSELDLKTLYSEVRVGSVEFQALEIMAGGWPWSRQIHRLLAQRLLQAGARAVVFDLLFPKPGPGDDAFQLTIDSSAGRIVVGSNFVSEVIGPAQQAWALTLPSSSIIPEAGPQDAAIGYVNFWPDSDGVVRKVQYRATLEQMEGGETPGTVGPETPASLAFRAAEKAGVGDVAEPFRPQLIRFSGPAGTFTPIPVYQIFVPLYWERNFADGQFFRNKVVLVGPAGNWTHDEHETPFGQMPGAELQLNSVNALLHQAFLHEASPASGYFLMGLAASAAWLLAAFLKRTWLRLGAFLFLGTAYLFAVKLAYDYASTVILSMPPLLTFVVSGLGSFIYDYTRETLEKLRVRRTLEAYVSQDVVRDVLDNPVSYLSALGGSRAHVALLMTDLRGFTTISEQMDSNKLVAQLNEYLSAMVDDIFNVRGSVDKFIGDAVLAVWGHLNSSGPAQDTARAVEAYFHMRESLRRLNADWQNRGMQTFAMGCGINFGEVIFGNIGSSRKMEPTVIGDPVNVVARLEGLTKDYGRDMLIGQAAAGLIQESYTLQFIDRVAVKGKSKPLDIFSVLGRAAESADASLTAYLEVYSRALAAYRAASFAEAVPLFRRCLDHWPDDQVASIYIERCLALTENPPAADWSGIHVATHK